MTESWAEGRLTRILRVYGPRRRWRQHRTYSHGPDNNWEALRLTQLVGARDWSISLVRTRKVKPGERR